MALTDILRVMRPGTVHLVVTSEHCLAAGGHFYSSVAFKRTLEALIFERYFGKYITNAEHPSSPLLIFKMLNHYVEVCTDCIDSGVSGKNYYILLYMYYPYTLHRGGHENSPLKYRTCFVIDPSKEHLRFGT